MLYFSLPVADSRLTFPVATPKVARVCDSRSSLKSLENRIRQNGIDRDSGFLRVEKKPLAVESVSRKRHGVRYPHSGIAHEQDESLEPMPAKTCARLRRNLQAVTRGQNLDHFLMRERHGRADRNFRELDCLRGIFLNPLAGKRKTKKSAEPFDFLARRALRILPRLAELAQGVQVK